MICRLPARQSAAPLLTWPILRGFQHKTVVKQAIHHDLAATMMRANHGIAAGGRATKLSATTASVSVVWESGFQRRLRSIRRVPLLSLYLACGLRLVPMAPPRRRR